jgi:hypothetical protein
MSSAQWDPRGEALSALRAIAADPQYGAQALASPQLMTNLLKDALPDAPREASVLIAAAEAGVPATLRQHVAQGMDVGTASQLAAGALADRTALTPEACAWATGSLAAVLITPAVPPVAPAPAAGTASLSGNDYPTLAAHQVPALTIPVPGRGGRRVSALVIAAACVTAAGGLAAILACATSFVHVFNSDGTYAYSASLFSSSTGYGGAWHWIPVAVAVGLSVVAALVLLLSRASWLRAAAGGVIAAFGAAVIIFFAGYEFTLGPVSAGAGPAGAEKLGGFGGLLLLVAGLLAVAAAAKD